jgi:hypothetical protein
VQAGRNKVADFEGIGSHHHGADKAEILKQISRLDTQAGPDVTFLRLNFSPVFALKDFN